MKWIILFVLALFALSNAVDAVESQWSGCWTAFPSIVHICRSEFGVEYEAKDSRGCGFLGAGKQALRERKFAGCEQTECYPEHLENLCERDFKGRLPVHKNYIYDCFAMVQMKRRARCCPN